MIDVKKISVLLHAIFATIILCVPVHGAISTTPTKSNVCDPKLLQRADNGDVNMQSYVAFLYATGKEGVQQDYDQARYWYQRVIDHKQADAKIVAHANLRMGLMYSTGNGVQKNYSEAMKCFRKAAEHGYYDAHLSIGMLYARGSGVEKDYDKALHWWKIAAENKHPKAKTLINLLEKEMGGKTALVPAVAQAGKAES